MAFTLLDSQKVSLSVTAADAAGNPDPSAKIAYAVDDATIAALTDNGDGTAEVVAGTIGTATVTATATDADGNAITGTLAVTVTGGDATTLSIVPGTPVAK